MHTRPVSLCPTCERGLYQEAERTTGPIQAIYCPHRQTLAVVGLQNGFIKTWTIEGPMTLEQAATVIGEGFRQGATAAERDLAGCH